MEEPNNNNKDSINGDCDDLRVLLCNSTCVSVHVFSVAPHSPGGLCFMLS